MPDDLLDRLSRAPDVEAPNLFAVDAADRLLVDTAAGLQAAALPPVGPGRLVVIGDHYGALTLGAVDRLSATGVRVHTDQLISERALQANAQRLAPAAELTLCGLDEQLLAGAGLVLLALPRALAALDEIAAAVARYAAPDVVLLAGGRVKHMTHAMNDVLGRHFDHVSAGLGRQKARVLTARGPQPGASVDPQRQHHADVGLTVVAHGAAFAGTKIDLGTRLLLAQIDRMPADLRDVVDLGCGTGVLACLIKRARPDAGVLATDSSAAAVASARATAAANGLDLEVARDLALSSVPAGSVDLVLCNAPFHTAATVAPMLAAPLFADAGRVLRPGGELWCVYNSHLDHKALLRAAVGPTEQVARDRSFTVTRSVRR